jgi:hypothetical protein
VAQAEVPEFKPQYRKKRKEKTNKQTCVRLALWEP